MTEKLPINLHCDSELNEQFAKFSSVLNKLEAQFNFQTMTAGWYGDEDDVVDIQLTLVSQESFEQQLRQMGNDNRIDFADDVVCYLDNNKKNIVVFIAVTTIEHDLLFEHNKLLAGFVDKKVSKVLNLVALELEFSPI